VKRSTAGTHHTHHHFPLITLVLLAGIFIGILSAFFVLKVFAQSTDVGVIHGCYKKENGLLRVLEAGQSCQKSEAALDWNIKGPPGSAASSSKPYLAFFCQGCYLVKAADRFKGQDMSNSTIGQSTFEGSDMSGTIFKQSVITDVNFKNTNLTGVDFSESNVPGWMEISAEFSGANLTGANFIDSKVSGNFTSSNLTNANFTNTNLRQASDLETANLTGVVWQNTTCPDGTNSNNNGNTCIGHF
jgi:hypothetical protein